MDIFFGIAFVVSFTGLLLAFVSAKKVQARLLALRAENERLRQSIAAIEDDKNNYMDYVGDALGQAYDGETLWDAAQRVLSERDRLRAENERLVNENAELRGEAALSYDPAIVGDAARYRWLTADHESGATREKCREILGRISVMSYSAASAAIDAALAAGGE